VVALSLLPVGCGSTGDTPAEAASSSGTPAPAPTVQGVIEALPPPLPTIAEIPSFEDLNPDPTILEVKLNASQQDVEIVPGHLTPSFTYNGQVPGPLLHARVGDRVIVHFQNDLKKPTTIHWHGLRISSEMDGNPMIQDPVPPGGSFTYDFTLPDAGTYWYHPHFNTAEQIDRGMYGAIVVEEKEPLAFSNERILVLDDVRLTSKFQISPFSSSGMDVMHGRFGNTLLVNGTTEPAKGSVKRGSIERWRLVNTASARTMVVGVQGASFRVIGTDGGLLPAPFTAKRMELPIGQRYDLEVTFDGEIGSTVHAVFFVDVQDANGNISEESRPLADYTIEGEGTATPPVYPVVTLPDQAPASPVEKKIVLNMGMVGGKMVFTINGKTGDKLPMDEFSQGAPVRFTLLNKSMPYHPFHLHGEFFQILTRGGKPSKETGLKDTVLLNQNETVEILTYFENPGRWMYHCHIPEHSDNGMMAEVMVQPSH